MFPKLENPTPALAKKSGKQVDWLETVCLQNVAIHEPPTILFVAMYDNSKTLVRCFVNHELAQIHH